MRSKKIRFFPTNIEKYVGDPSAIICRSGWELAVCRWLDVNPLIASWGSETVIIPYRMDGKPGTHRYHVDFVITTTEGKTTLVEVKPKNQVKVPRRSASGRATKRSIWEAKTLAVNLAKWQAASNYAKKHDMIFKVWTEHFLEKMLVLPNRSWR